MPQQRTHNYEIARSAEENRRRVLGLLVLIALVAAAELLLSPALLVAHGRMVLSEVTPDTFEQKWFEDRFGLLETPSKAEGQKRIVYLSNSHALTGGRISNHLENMLGELTDGRYEVFDLSNGGMFSPEMHQRLIAAMDVQPDAVLLGVSYIGFSDHMGLARQNHSARQFFKPSVFAELDSGFWFRNYDIGLFANEAFANVSIVYRLRELLRRIIDNGLHLHVTSNLDPSRSIALNVNVNKTWQFPDGYDRNLFQWRLYSVGRDAHLDELAEMSRLTREHDLPLLVHNAPIDWEKGIYRHKPEDAALFRRQISEHLKGSTAFDDYQDVLPVDLTTYDALHPTWHGARLHAFGALLQLHEQGLLPEQVTTNDLFAAFRSTAKRPPLDAQQLRPATKSELSRFTRLDISEPANAVSLLQRLMALEPGSAASAKLTIRFARHLEVIRRGLSRRYVISDENLLQAFEFERFQIAGSARAFQLALRDVLLQNIQKLNIRSPESRVLRTWRKEGADSAVALEIETPEGKQFLLIDIFGDNSFLSIAPVGSQVPHPLKEVSDEILKQVGI